MNINTNLTQFDSKFVLFLFFIMTHEVPDPAGSTTLVHSTVREQGLQVAEDSDGDPDPYVLGPPESAS